MQVITGILLKNLYVGLKFFLQFGFWGLTHSALRTSPISLFCSFISFYDQKMSLQFFFYCFCKILEMKLWKVYKKYRLTKQNFLCRLFLDIKGRVLFDSVQLWKYHFHRSIMQFFKVVCGAKRRSNSSLKYFAARRAANTVSPSALRR